MIFALHNSHNKLTRGETNNWDLFPQNKSKNWWVQVFCFSSLMMSSSKQDHSVFNVLFSADSLRFPFCWVQWFKSLQTFINVKGKLRVKWSVIFSKSSPRPAVMPVCVCVCVCVCIFWFYTNAEDMWMYVIFSLDHIISTRSRSKTMYYLSTSIVMIWVWN